jgi:hypothetical protein
VYFYYFTVTSPWRRAISFIWINSNPLPPKMICAKSGYNWPSGSGEDFLRDSTLFLHFCNYLPFEEDLALYLKKKTNLNSLHQRIICTMFDWIWPAGFGGEDFQNFSVHFYSFTITSPWRGAIPFPQGWLTFVRSLVILGLVVLEKIFKWPHPLLHFCDDLPFEDDLALYLNKLQFPSPKDNLYQVWLNLACSFWRRF